jgi:alpha(1,3/1,4) fucosyltransferase
MLVLFKPVHHYLLENKLFELNCFYKGWHLEGYHYLAQMGKERGIEFATWDTQPLDKADVIIIQDLPATKAEMVEVKRKAPQAKLILMNVETPLGRNYMWDKANHKLFDAVLTYNRAICDNYCYYHYYLPIGEPPQIEDLAFSARRPLTIINNNRLLGPSNLFYFRQRGLAGLPGVGVFFSGWHVTLNAFLRLSRGETYSARRKIARLAEREFPDVLDVYGQGWSGEPVGWPHTLIAPKPFACHRTTTAGKTDTLIKYRFALAYENQTSNVGYVSEKIFDCLYAGVVPIYIGEKNIGDYVWPSAFVDARQFRNNRELLAFAQRCSESEWQQYRDQGKAFLQSDDIKKFQKENFASTILKTVKEVSTKQLV